MPWGGKAMNHSSSITKPVTRRRFWTAAIVVALMMAAPVLEPLFGEAQCAKTQSKKTQETRTEATEKNSVPVAPQIVVIAENIEVPGEELTLAALLPASTPPELLQDARSIDLGRSPLLGSVRALSKKEIEARLKNSPETLRAIRLPEQVIVSRRSFAIAPERLQGAIRNFLRIRGWSTADLYGEGAAQVEGLARIALPDAMLEVEDAAWDARQNRLQFRIHCVARAACGSFFADAQPSPGMASLWRQRLGGMQRTSPSTSLASAQAQATGAGAKKTPEAALALAGQPATLILQGKGIRITMPVICLQRGALAQKIRVRDVPGKHMFEARVIGAELLQAEL